ncbi:hypothetical protein Tco_0878116 [Tanacetum coccineum]|uniref:Uncharacterized protein n=1 Tax=Tanacetum coccineum TaxID=301880 RepID=A0ABQ5BWZ8_9ASTR
MFPQLNSGLVFPAFLPIDDPIACLNKAKAFMSTVFSSRFPSIKNQLRTYSNPQNHATIPDGSVNVQQVQDDRVLDERSSSGNENRSSDHESTSSGNDADADIGPLYDSDTVSEVPHSSNDTFENLFTHGIHSQEQPESIPDTYEVNENNNNIIFDIPNMDPDRDKEEHDDVDYVQQCVFFASLISNLKCDVDKCNKVNREAQQANALLINELERYKEKEKHFLKDMTIESEYCKKIKRLNDEISYLKSQACEKDKTFAKENEKYDEYVQPLLKRKNKLEKKTQEFFKQINDLANRL